MSQPPQYRFADAPGKDPAESMPVELVCFPMCANFWQPNRSYGLGEYVRPTQTRATGYSYKITTAGLSGAKEPVWPTTGTVGDGSATWTTDVASTNGINAITSPSAVSDPIGLTISGVSVDTDATTILATYAGGVEGRFYDAVFSFTLNGVPRVARQRVCVKKR